MKKNNFGLRLQPWPMEEARKVAKAEGVAVNQFTNVAVAEKVAGLIELSSQEYFATNQRPGFQAPDLSSLKCTVFANRVVVPLEHLFPSVASRRTTP